MYGNYLLEAGVYNYDLSDIDKRSLDEAIWLIENKTTIRKTAKEFLISKSQLHRDLHYIKNLSYELYQCVVRQLKKNKENALKAF